MGRGWALQETVNVDYQIDLFTGHSKRKSVFDEIRVDFKRVLLAVKKTFRIGSNTVHAT